MRRKKIFSILNTLLEISIIKFIYYNFLSSKVIRHGRGYLVPYKNAVISLGINAKIELYDDNFYVNYHKPSLCSKAEAYVKLLEGATLIIRGRTVLNYLSTIEVHNNAIVDVGEAYINTGAVILAAKRIDIGRDVLISRQVFIFDSDHHIICNEQGKQTNTAAEISIGNHVWIGLKCTILRGAKLEEGVVVAADSVVGGKIKKGLLAQGNPARGFMPIIWEK